MKADQQIIKNADAYRKRTGSNFSPFPEIQKKLLGFTMIIGGFPMENESQIS